MHRSNPQSPIPNPAPLRSLSSRAWYALVKSVVHAAAALVYRARYTGLRNVPLTGPLVVVANHQSHLDPPIIGAGFPWRLNYFARKSLFESPAFAWLISSFDAIPIDRETAPLSGMRETIRRLRRGEAVLMFPEGARTWDGEIGPMKSGFVLLAKRSGAAVLPTVIEGAFQAWPRRNRFPWLGTIHVHFGEVIPADQAGSLSEAALVAEVAARIKACRALLRARPAFGGMTG